MEEEKNGKRAKLPKCGERDLRLIGGKENVISSALCDKAPSGVERMKNWQM